LNQIYRTYKVKKRDTIFSIANNNNLDCYELIDYHNKRAENHEKIKGRLPDFLKEVILPPEGYTLKNGKEVWTLENLQEPNVLQESYFGKLRFKPYNKDLSYGVLKKIKNGVKENTIKYNVNIRFYPTDKFGMQTVSVNIINSKIFINDQEPSLVADELAVTCTEILYPIVFQLDKNANLIEIQNHKDILKRWQKQKKTKLKYYQGKTAQDYINSFEQTINDKGLCLFYLKNDWFYHLYFNEIYSVYANDLLKEDKVFFPIIPNTNPIMFNVKKSANKFIKTNKIKIDIKGACSDNRSKEELVNKIYYPAFYTKNRPSVKGNYRCMYILKPDNNTIQHAFLESSLELNSLKQISISISEIIDDK